MSSEVIDLLLRISHGKGAGGYSVEADLNLDEGQHFGPEPLKLDLSSFLKKELLNEQYGEELFKALFNGAVGAAYQQALGARNVWGKGKLLIRLCIANDVAELHALAWERMRFEQDKIGKAISAAKEISFFRYAEIEKPLPPAMKRKGCVRLLFFISNPDLSEYSYLPPLDVQEEIKSIRDGLDEAVKKRRAKVAIYVGQSGISEELQRELKGSGYRVLKARKEKFGDLENLVEFLQKGKYHILHFIGHGRFKEGTPTASLAMGDAGGKVQWISGTEFAEKLQSSKLQMVFLSACDSAKYDSEKGDFSVSLAEQLIRAGIPTVIAPQARIKVSTMQQFVSDFYPELLSNGYIDEALSKVRRAISRQNTLDWSIPVLVTRRKDGCLFDQPSIFEKTGLVVIPIVLLVLAMVFAMKNYLQDPDPILTGSELNIAVAEFSQDPEGKRKSAEGTEMAYWLRDELKVGIAELGYSPERVDIAVVDSVGAQHKSAERLFNDIDQTSPDDAVTLLIYGYVSQTPDDHYVVYFMARDPQEALEIGDALSGELGWQSAEVKGYSNILMLFSVGLVKLYANDLQGARDYFNRAITEAEAADLSEVLDTLYFFKGRTLAALDSDPKNVIDAYQMALSYNAQYAMAHIGLGNVYYADFVESVQSGESIDCQASIPALQEFEAALEAETQHYTSWMRGKAYVGVGNTKSLCGQITGENTVLEEAVSAYSRALVEYEKANASKEYLALAHYTRGVAYERLERWQEASEDYRWCVEHAGTRQSLAGECSRGLEKTEVHND